MKPACVNAWYIDVLAEPQTQFDRRTRQKAGLPCHLRDGLHGTLAALLQLAVGRVVLQARVVRLQRLLVLLHEELQVALAAVAFCEVRRQPYALIRILQGARTFALAYNQRILVASALSALGNIGKTTCVHLILAEIGRM